MREPVPSRGVKSLNYLSYIILKWSIFIFSLLVDDGGPNPANGCTGLLPYAYAGHNTFSPWERPWLWNPAQHNPSGSLSKAYKALDCEPIEGKGHVLFISVDPQPSTLLEMFHSWFFELTWDTLIDESQAFKIIKNKSTLLITSLVLDRTYSYDSSVINVTSILLNFQHFPQAMDHSLVSGYIGVVYWSLIYVELWTGRLTVNFYYSHFKGNKDDRDWRMSTWH